MKDQLLHALAFGDRVRVLAATTTHLVTTAAEIHGTSPTATIALGRTLTCAGIMARTLKNLERLTIQIQGGGPLGLVLGRAMPDGSIYGTVGNPGVEIARREDGEFDVAGAVGTTGRLMVIRDLGLKEPYIGVTNLVSGEISDDLAHYYMTSEQVRSALGAGVLVGPEGVRAAGGFLVQILGGVAEDELRELETRLILLSTMSRDIEAGMSAHDIVRRLSGDDHRIVGESELRYDCPFDEQHYVNHIAGLDAEAISQIFEGDESVPVTCEFTRRTFHITREAVMAARA